MRYILFLLSILFFNSFLWADPGTDSAGSGIQVNLGNYKTSSTNSDSGYPQSLTDKYSIGSPTYDLTTIPNYSYGTGSGTIRFGRPTCSPETPEACVLISSCISAGGYWNAIDSNCGRATCHFGTTQDIADPTKCKCNNDPYAYVQRGNFLQNCPNICFSRANQTYSFFKKSCECTEGYTMATNGTCNPNAAPPQPPPAVSDCWHELVEKASACETSANTAVTQCEPAAEDDTMKAMRGLLLSGSGSAGENCERAATASTSGFYQTEDNRRTCDEGINSCKTSCGDAKTYMNANKERIYNACRERAFQDQVNAGPPLPADRFNPLWDSENKASLDSQFQSLLARVDSSRTTCETGTAAKNREKLSATMNEMNTSSKDASLCACQLNPNRKDCSTTPPGPADCSENLSLPGCAKVADNCFDPKNTTIKCICFRNPESLACKEGVQANLNIKAVETNASSFAGTKSATDTRSSSTGTSGKNAVAVTTVGAGGERYSFNAADESGVAAPPTASGSAVSSLASNAAAPVGGGGGSLGGRNASTSANSSAPATNDDPSLRKKLGGLFDTAKSALGGLFKKGSGSSEITEGDYRDGGYGTNRAFDAKKYRPRTIVRGIASDEELAGKHEDIWKVMNKQYKIQDQKDNFIFDAGKN